jgi:hypothetical protein
VRARLLATGIIVAALSAACGGSGSKQSTAATPSSTTTLSASLSTTTEAPTSSATPQPQEKPEDAAKRHITEEAQGQWGLAYSDLLPQQQAAIVRDTFIKCGEQVAVPEITGLHVIKVYAESTPTPGAGDLDSTAVTIKIGLQGGQSETDTVHEYNVDGGWRSSVDQPTFDAESKGQCRA